jgi:hypothetical protein
MAASTVSLVTDISRVAKIAYDNLLIHGRGLYNADQIVIRITHLEIPATKRFLEMQGDVSADLAVAAAKFSVGASLIKPKFEEALAKGDDITKSRMADEIQHLAKPVFEKAIAFAKELVKAYPPAKDELASTLALEERLLAASPPLQNAIRVGAD